MKQFASFSSQRAPLASRRIRCLGILGALLLGACSSASGESSPEDVVVSSLSANGATANVVINNDWGSGYCASVSVKNDGTVAAASWRAK